MAAEPITIYSHKIDPVGVLKLLRQMAPDLRIEGPEDNWKAITIEQPRGFLRKAACITFGHDRSYYDSPEFATQMRGMMGYFSRFKQTENRDVVMHLINSFRFGLTLFPMPEPELQITSDDARLKYVFAVVRHLDGAIFTPSALRDASGKVLFGAGGPDPTAKMPAIYRDVPQAPVNQLTRAEGGMKPNAGDPPPPSAQRVARRACVLAAVCGRALLEQEDKADPGVEETRKRLLQWVDNIRVRAEFEAVELNILEAPLGTPPPQVTANATWRLEGLGVLAWALNRYELRPHDELVNPPDLLKSLAILNADAAKALIAAPNLRSQDELKTLQERLFAVHWRITDFRLKHKSIDFASVAKTAWFGPLDVSNLPMIDNDLAINGKAIAQADERSVGITTSAAMERHLAINWLCGGSEIYSRTDVST